MKYLPIILIIIFLLSLCFHGIAITPTGLYIDTRGFAYDIVKHIECEWIQIDCNE